MSTPIPTDYAFGNRTAADVYEELTRERSGVVDKARELATISIPTLFPPEGYRPGDTLPPPNQSINARCIVNLGSRIMFTALPPGKPVLKYNIIEHKLQPDIDADPALYSETLLALSRREIANRQRLEATKVRTAYVQAAMQLIIAGNVLWRHIDIDNPSVHRADTYVVKRNSVGEQLLTILLQKVNLIDLDEETKGFIENIRLTNRKPNAGGKKGDFEDEVEVYCCCKLHQVSKTEKVWLYWEEFMGEVIPGTDVRCHYDEPPLYAAWLVPNYGYNWGTSYCELYQGDMYLVENANGALNDMAEAAALNIIFFQPGGVTSKRAFDRAENNKTMYGNAQDISVFRLEKNNDASFVDTHAGKAERRLGAAFLMVSSIQRDAERVTAEEWRMMASELDQAMGGLYSELAQGMGRNIIMRFLALQHDEDPTLKPLPKGIIRVGVITGIDALGLNDEEAALENALGVLNKVLGPQGLATLLNGTDVVRRVLAGNSVKPDGMVKDEQQQQQEADGAKQDAMKAELLKQGTGPLVKEVAGGVAGNITPQMMQQFAQANNLTQPQQQ